jgi:NADPH:quinone reductase-like Zn-dependent oxidoreductase
MMKAVRFNRFGGPEVLEIVDLPDPQVGPDQVRIAVRAAGVNPSDWKNRKGLMDGELPQTMGPEAAGVVDELGEGVADVAVGDRVFGLSAEGAAQAELAVLSYYAPIPPSIDFPGAAALPAAIETAARALDQLGVGSASTLIINGASGSVGSAAVQLAVVRGARVIGTASPANHAYLRSLGAEPVAYGEGVVERVRALPPDGVDVALDVAGSGVLPDLIELVGGREHVVTIADFGGAQEHGGDVQQWGRWPRGPRARRDRRVDRVWALLAPGRADLPARTGRRGAPGERGRSRAREVRAAGRLSAPRGRHAGDCSAVCSQRQRRGAPLAPGRGAHSARGLVAAFSRERQRSAGRCADRWRAVLKGEVSHAPNKGPPA